MKIQPDAFYRSLVKATFPAYRGRKFSLEVQTSALDVRDYWDGGSRTFYAFVNLDTGKVVSMPEQGINNREVAGASNVMLPEGVACVEMAIMQGHNCGITVTVHAANVVGGNLIAPAARRLVA